MRFLAIFSLVALLELATFFWVETRIGLGSALGLALTTAILGSFLVRRAGLAVLARIQEKASKGLAPGRELSDGAAILVAGAFLISPGFITDILGFLLLVPAVGLLVHHVVGRRVLRRFTVVTQGFQTRHGPRAGPVGDDVIDVDPIGD